MHKDPQSKANFKTDRIQILTLIAILSSGQEANLFAQEVFHWVDENGVSHFSQWAPQETVPDLSVMILDTAEPELSEDDIYGVEEQKKQMEAFWSEFEAKREASQERKRSNNQQTVVTYQQSAYDGPALWPYIPPRRQPRPSRPEQLIVKPPESVPYRPPGKRNQ